VRLCRSLRIAVKERLRQMEDQDVADSWEEAQEELVRV
jgi:hypothetical protein